MLTRRSIRVLLAPTAIAGALLCAASCGGFSEGDYVYYKIALTKEKSDEGCYPDETVPDSIKDDSTTLRSGASIVLYLAGSAPEEKDEALLDLGGTVLGGKATDDGYHFSGETVDVEVPPAGVRFDADHDGIDDLLDSMIDADNDGLDDKSFGVDPLVDTDNDSIDDRSGDPLVDADGDGKDDRITQIPSKTKLIKTTTITVDLKIDGSTISGFTESVTEPKCEGNDCPINAKKACTRTADFKGVRINEVQVDLKGNTPAQSPPGDDF